MNNCLVFTHRCFDDWKPCCVLHSSGSVSTGMILNICLCYRLKHITHKINIGMVLEMSETKRYNYTFDVTTIPQA